LEQIGEPGRERSVAALGKRRSGKRFRQNEKGGSSDPPFSVNKFWFALLSQCSSDAAYASLGVSSLNSGRLNGRLFFAQIPALANCLMCKRSYIHFL
jgi:hypothetical protein